MSEELAKLSVVLDAQMERFSRAMQRAVKVSDGTAKNIEKSMNRSDRAVNALGAGFKRMLATAGLAIGAKQVVSFADKIDILQDRVKDATRATGDFNTVWTSLRDTAIDTGGDLAANVSLFQRLATRAQELGSTNGQILKLTDTISKLGVIGGSTTAEMANGTLQLAQGLGEGVFRAQEFNSIMENTPAIADAIAKGMGKSVSQLRSMVIQGKLTSREVFEALLTQSNDVEERFKKIPSRLSRSWDSALTAMGAKVDRLNDKLKATETLANALSNFASFITPDEEKTATQLKDSIRELNEQLWELALANQAIGSRPQDTILGLVPGRLEREKAANDRQIQYLRKQRAELYTLLNGKDGGSAASPSQAPLPPLSDGGFVGKRKDLTGTIKYPSADELAAVRGELKALEIDVLRSQGRIDDAIMATADMQIAEWNKIAQETPMLAEDASKAIVLINQRAALEIEQFGEEAQKVHKRMEEQSYRLRQASEEWTNALNQGLADAIFRAKSFGDILDALLKRLLNSALFGLDGKGGLLGGITNTLGTAIGSIFTPGFAGGGQTSVPSIVGERGRETIVGSGLFIPKGSAKVINAADTRSRGGGGVTVYQTVNFDTTVAPTVKAMIESALPSVAEAAARGAVVHLNRGT